jgi:hypothetical protein
MPETCQGAGEPTSQTETSRNGAAWDMLAIERKLDLDEKKPD